MIARMIFQNIQGTYKMVGDLRRSQAEKKFSLIRVEINNENVQCDRISTMKIPKVIDSLSTRATEIFNQQIAYHLISALKI
jgi:hypothetical protein